MPPTVPAPPPARARDGLDCDLDLGHGEDRLYVRGVVDDLSLPLFRDELREALRTCAGRRLVIDVGDLRHLCAAGAGLLAGTLAACVVGRGPTTVVVEADGSCPTRPVLDLGAVPDAAAPGGGPLGPRDEVAGSTATGVVGPDG